MKPATPKRKLQFIEKFGPKALRTGMTEMLAIHGESWLTDDQLSDIARYHTDEYRAAQRRNRQNRRRAA